MQDNEMITTNVDTENEQTATVAQNSAPDVDKMRRKKEWIRYLVTFGVLGVLTVLLAWARGAFGGGATVDIVRLWSDAFTVVGMLAICLGVLVVVSNGGAFDIIVYSVKYLFRMLKKDPIDRKYGGYYEYKQSRAEKKRSFWYMIIIGAVYVLVGVALLLYFYQLRK